MPAAVYSSVSYTHLDVYKRQEKENNIMKKFVCTVCGYVYEGEAAPAECPICHAPADKFKEQTGEREWAAEHVVGVAKGVSEDIFADLRANFEGECSEVGMYLAMARVCLLYTSPPCPLSYPVWIISLHGAALLLSFSSSFQLFLYHLLLYIVITHQM